MTPRTLTTLESQCQEHLRRWQKWCHQFSSHHFVWIWSKTICTWILGNWNCNILGPCPKVFACLNIVAQQKALEYLMRRGASDGDEMRDFLKALQLPHRDKNRRLQCDTCDPGMSCIKCMFAFNMGWLNTVISLVLECWQIAIWLSQCMDKQQACLQDSGLKRIHHQRLQVDSFWR